MTKRPEAISPSSLRSQIIVAGAVFLSHKAECLEWVAQGDGDRIVLTRSWFPATASKTRYSQRRFLFASQAGLSFGSTIWETHAEFDATTKRWRKTVGSISSSLCANDPSLEVVDHGRYKVGGGDVYLTRAACEKRWPKQQRTTAAQGGGK